MLQDSILRKTIAVLAVFMFVHLFNVPSNAQKNNSGDFNLSENAIQNLNMGIKSENKGLKKNSIYFAGLYLVDEAAETLVEQLKVEEDPSLRILITKALYLIDNDKFMKEIKRLAKNDENQNVKEFAQRIYSIIQLEKTLNVAEVSN